ASLKKKERRKRKRQALAKAQVRESGQLSSVMSYCMLPVLRQRRHAEWLERERLAQEEFRLRCEREETARKRKEEEEERIKEEWEAQQRREEEEKEQKQQAKRDREEAVQKMLDQAESQLENGGPWKNPEAPDFGTEQDRANCPFFLKTGACRFGDRCSRKHVHPLSSPTLMIRGMFATFGMDQRSRDDYDTDACLEYSEEEVLQQFVDFYEDVLPEFKGAGKVVQFKVSCNFEPHLRGNVYVQFDTEEQCREAFMMFNGRWYAGKQLQCEFSPVTRWKTAICGLFDRQKCPKGKHCNFLHVYRNPGNEFWEADRDLHMSPDRGGGGVGSFTGRFSERSNRSSWTERSQSRRGDRERRSRSRESRVSQRRRASVQSDRSWVSRNSTRPRSRSRDRGRVRRDGSRDRDRNKRECRGRLSTESRGTSSRRSRSGSPTGSLKRKGHRTKSRSPKKSSQKDRRPSDDVAATTPSQHKHSKKSKKKSKKKKKQKKEKKSESPVGQSSSGESDKEEKPHGNRDDLVPGTRTADMDQTTPETARASAIQSLRLHMRDSNPVHADIQTVVKETGALCSPREPVAPHSPSRGDLDSTGPTRGDTDDSPEVNAVSPYIQIKSEASSHGVENRRETPPDLLDND
uniref:Zinc finger (CCCH type), RNA-binding motif and serine/arginine rich 2 n=1 Tax=Esox lucius TaxID=8010 RepID=A0AAY5L2I2_ESOLU